MKCPQCKEGELVQRKGAKGAFLGCNKFPACRHTQSMEERVGTNEGGVFSVVPQDNSNITSFFTPSPNTPQPSAAPLASRKDELIIAQTLTKCCSEIMAARTEVTVEMVKNIQDMVWDTFEVMLDRVSK